MPFKCMETNRMIEFANLDLLSHTLSEKIARQLTQAINQKGHALLAVSGGSTPKSLFIKLSKINIDWKKVWVVLVDERWVGRDDTASNEYLIKTTLLTGLAAKANFVPLKSKSATAKIEQNNCNILLQTLPDAIDVLILGMGDDGHTASIFPCADKTRLKQLLSADNPLRAMAITPNTAPHERMSLTASYLLTSEHSYLLLKGPQKLITFNKALAGENITQMPIRAFLNKELNKELNKQVNKSVDKHNDKNPAPLEVYYAKQ